MDNIFEGRELSDQVAQKMREAILYNKEFNLLPIYKIVKKTHKPAQVLPSGQDRFNYFELNKENSNIKFFLAAFPAHLENPKIHPEFELVLKELSYKFYALNPCPSGIYSLFFSSDLNENEYNKKIMYYNSPSGYSEVNTSLEQKKIIEQFCEKYSDYCFPRFNEDGSFDLKIQLDFLGKYFSFYIPFSNHELIKGAETNFI